MGDNNSANEFPGFCKRQLKGTAGELGNPFSVFLCTVRKGVQRRVLLSKTLFLGYLLSEIEPGICIYLCTIIPASLSTNICVWIKISCIVGILHLAYNQKIQKLNPLNPQLGEKFTFLLSHRSSCSPSRKQAQDLNSRPCNQAGVNTSNAALLCVWLCRNRRPIIMASCGWIGWVFVTRLEMVNATPQEVNEVKLLLCFLDAATLHVEQ